MKRTLDRTRWEAAAFTLVEMLVSMGVLMLIMAVLFSISNETGSLWRRTSGKIEQFREARQAYESVTRRLSQATLNTYWDYHYPNDDTTKQPDRYIRQSELRFISGPASALIGSAVPLRPTHAVFFQAPLGYSDTAQYQAFENLLNTWGYFVEFGPDERPPFINELTKPPALRHRFRLKELIEPSENLTLYKYTSGMGQYSAGKANNTLYSSIDPPAGKTGKEWFTEPLNSTNSQTRVLAENVIALIIRPQLSPQDESALPVPPATFGAALSPTYRYDSTATFNGSLAPAAANQAALNPKHQLPPVVQMTMVALDEASAVRIETGSTAPDFALDDLFRDATKYAADLATLEATLSARHLNYRVFTSNVVLKGAKWSREQKN